MTDFPKHSFESRHLQQKKGPCPETFTNSWIRNSTEYAHYQNIATVTGNRFRGLDLGPLKENFVPLFTHHIRVCFCFEKGGAGGGDCREIHMRFEFSQHINKRFNYHLTQFFAFICHFWTHFERTYSFVFYYILFSKIWFPSFILFSLLHNYIPHISSLWGVYLSWSGMQPQHHPILSI